jgi:hypothetical protein
MRRTLEGVSRARRTPLFYSHTSPRLRGEVEAEGFG